MAAAEDSVVRVIARDCFASGVERGREQMHRELLSEMDREMRAMSASGELTECSAHEALMRIRMRVFR